MCAQNPGRLCQGRNARVGFKRSADQAALGTPSRLCFQHWSISRKGDPASGRSNDDQAQRLNIAEDDRIASIAMDTHHRYRRKDHQARWRNERRRSLEPLMEKKSRHRLSSSSEARRDGEEDRRACITGERRGDHVLSRKNTEVDETSELEAKMAG